jgi:c-di-GMP-related signal transduction protein
VLKVQYASEIASYLIVEIFHIVRSEHMTAEGGLVTEISTNLIIDTLPVSVLPKKKKMKGREECEMLEKLLSAFQV